VVQNAVIHFVEPDWQGHLAFDAHLYAPNGPMVDRVAQEHIARLNASQTRVGIATLVLLANIPHVHSKIRHWSHLPGHSATVTILYNELIHYSRPQ
jgi:hypothetical protein